MGKRNITKNSSCDLKCSVNDYADESVKMWDSLGYSAKERKEKKKGDSFGYLIPEMSNSRQLMPECYTHGLFCHTCFFSFLINNYTRTPRVHSLSFS